MRPSGFVILDFIKIQEGVAGDIYWKYLASKLCQDDTKNMIEEKEKTYPW